MKPPVRDLTTGLAEIKQNEVLLFNISPSVNFNRTFEMKKFLPSLTDCNEYLPRRPRQTDRNFSTSPSVLCLCEFDYISGLNVNVI